MKKIFITIIAMLLPLMAFGTTKKTIHVATAGTLSNFISDEEKYQIEELILTGELNGTDIRFIRDMSGINYEKYGVGTFSTITTSGLLKVLDISNAKIVEGGDVYYAWTNKTIEIEYEYRTHNNSISDYMFYGCKLTSLRIPNNVTSIGSNAFNSDLFADQSEGLLYLDKWLVGYKGYPVGEIVIAEGTIGIADSAFKNCASITSVNIPNSVISIGNYSFSGCSGLTSVTIPNSVTSIGYHSFEGCSNLVSVTISNSVTSIGSYAFHLCSSLNSIIIPNSVISIEEGAFRSCGVLTSIVIPNSVTSIGSWAFLDTGWYENQNDGLLYLDNWLLDYKGNKPTGNISITEGTRGIAGSAFYCCSDLTSVNIPTGLNYIERRAFYECTGLTSMVIPNSVTKIGEYAFWGCSGLTSVVSQIENPFEIGDDVFSSYTTANLFVPAGTESAYRSKSGWDQFKNVVEVEKKRTIHVETAGTLSDFVLDEEKYFLQELTLTGELNGTDIACIRRMAGAPVNYLDGKFFDEEESGEVFGKLAVLDISGATIVSGGNNYYKNWHELSSDWDDEYYIEKNSTSNNSISMNMFIDCKLTNVFLPNNINSIEWGAFDNCTNLTTIIIPNSVTNIGNSAFESCSGLTSVTIGNSVTSIEDRAFCGCSALTSITIPNSVISIGSDAFSGTGWYNNQSDGILYLDNWLIGCKGDNSTGKIDVNEGTRGIADSAFSGCSGLTSVTIPNSVKSIGEGAFKGCSSLTSMTIPNNVKTICKSAFFGCSGLTSITISDSVTSIEEAAFCGCTSLTSITIPNCVTSIGNYAFWGCSSLTSVTIPNSVISIGNYAFVSLTSVVIGKNVKSIGNAAFSYYLEDPTTTVISLIENPFPILGEIMGDINSVFSYRSFKEGTLYVPVGTINKYKTTDGWKEFKNIRELPVGDVNLDLEVNQTDLDAVTNHIMGKDSEGFYECLADLNGDDKVNAVDVVKLVDILNIQEGLSMDWQTKYSNQVVSSLSCTLNNDGDKAIQLTKCELYCNQSLVSSANFKVTLASGWSKKCSFDELADYSAKTGFSVVWYYTYNGESFTYCCDLSE